MISFNEFKTVVNYAISPDMEVKTLGRAIAEINNISLYIGVLVHIMQFNDLDCIIGIYWQNNTNVIGFCPWPNHRHYTINDENLLLIWNEVLTLHCQQY